MVMIGAWWQRIGPWATPTLIVVEVALVWSGLHSLGGAVAIGMSVEILLVVTAIGAGATAIRPYRQDRARGHDRCAAAETLWCS
jgi:hypothetical protein